MLLPQTHTLKISINCLNEKPFAPWKDYKTNRLLLKKNWMTSFFNWLKLLLLQAEFWNSSVGWGNSSYFEWNKSSNWKTDTTWCSKFKGIDKSHGVPKGWIIDRKTLKTLKHQWISPLFLILEVQVEYNFEFYKSEIPTDIPITVLSTQKSRIFPCDISLPINSTSNLILMESSEEDYSTWRFYLSVARELSHTVPTPVQKVQMCKFCWNLLSM